MKFEKEEIATFGAARTGGTPVSHHERERFYHWQLRILATSTAGYAIFYFVRTNIPVAMPKLKEDPRIHYTTLGLFLTLHGVVYGCSKFFNGFLGDRFNARIFMATGLILSAIANICFGFSSAIWLMGLLWIANGWFQGMGFPPCARLLTHWFSPKELATKMSIWNSSHSIGAGVIAILCSVLVKSSWRLCFIVPGIIAIIAGVGLLIFLRDTPESLGLPPVEAMERARGFEVVPLQQAYHEHEPLTGPTPVEAAVEPSPHLDDRSAARLVFGNPYIWLVSLANFLVYTIRYGVLNWAPTFLTEFKKISLTHASWMTAGFEGAGITGALLAGYLTDRYFAGKAVRIALLSMLLCAGTLFVFWHWPKQSELNSTILIALIGFFIYPAQCLIGIAAANLATRRAAATAVGLTGFFGYGSTVLSGYGLGLLVQHFGWDRAFAALVATALVGVVIFAIAWNAPAHGYARDD